MESKYPPHYRQQAEIGIAFITKLLDIDEVDAFDKDIAAATFDEHCRQFDVDRDTLIAGLIQTNFASLALAAKLLGVSMKRMNMLLGVANQEV